MRRVSGDGKLGYLVVFKIKLGYVDLLDESSFDSEWQVPQARESMEVNLLWGYKH